MLICAMLIEEQHSRATRVLRSLRRWRSGSVSALLALAMSACAGASPIDVPPLRPQLPNDLREPEGPAPDFRRPPRLEDHQPKSDAEADATIEELEKLRDSHEKDRRQAIEAQ